jgi:hypothetical protein
MLTARKITGIVSGGAELRTLRWRLGPLTVLALLITTASSSTNAVAGQTGAIAGTGARATLASFAGTWGGHTRGLTIAANGIGKEVVYAGCCDHVINLRLRLSRPRGTENNATALVQVVAEHIYDPADFSNAYPAPHVGETRTLRLRNGVITEPMTHLTYCETAQQARGTCGA